MPCLVLVFDSLCLLPLVLVLKVCSLDCFETEKHGAAMAIKISYIENICKSHTVLQQYRLNKSSMCCNNLFFSSGIEAQKLSVINNLPSLLESNANDAMKQVMPLVRVSIICNRCIFLLKSFLSGLPSSTRSP